MEILESIRRSGVLEERGNNDYSNVLMDDGSLLTPISKEFGITERDDKEIVEDIEEIKIQDQVEDHQNPMTLDELEPVCSAWNIQFDNMPETFEVHEVKKDLPPKPEKKTATKIHETYRKINDPAP